jgi:uncharacterized protein (TIGR02391 family)
MHLRQLVDSIPDVAVFLQLEPEELGQRVLVCIGRRYPRGENFYPTAFADEFWQHGEEVYPPAQRRPIKLAMQEAIGWLTRQGLIMQDPDQTGAYFVLTRRGRQALESSSFAEFKAAHTLPREILHPSIANSVWMAFVRGEYDVAVFQAMKAVEVAVRDASGLGNSVIGVPLMREAFHAERGALTDQQSEKGEREALAALFAGALGSYKNPHSHRDIPMERPAEALEVIMLANHLLRIVDGRRANRTSGQSNAAASD